MRWKIGAALVVMVLAAGCATGSRNAGESERVTRGRYLVTIMDCTGCHTPGALGGQPDPSRYLAGATVGFGFPGGVVYPPNLTPDPETGLGRWTDAEIIRAFRHGQSRDGRPLVPIMPWPSYAAITESDAQAVVAFLRTIPPIRHQAPRNAKPGERAPAPYMTLTEPK
jgi:mono/diheme cytochrome c family protein